jgi:hypothetical protein
MDLPDLANLTEELLNESLINFSKEMAQINGSVSWDIIQK